MKIWFVICIWLCYFSISKLVKENSEIIYKSIKRTEPFNYLVCFNLKEIEALTNKTTVDLQQLDKIVSSYVSIYFSKNFNKFNNQLKKRFNMTKFKELVLNPIESKDYLILNHKFCFILENKDGLNYFRRFLQTTEFYLFKNDTYDLYKLKSINDKVDLLVVKNKEYPYSNCTKNYSKFKCINECFKEKHQLSKYFYAANENEIILLNYEYNQTIKDEEYKCLSECKRSDCKLVHFVPFSSFYLESKLNVFEADFFISRSEFWIQLFGLICLIENISFYQLISKSFKFLKPKVKKIKKIEIRKRVIKVKKPERYLHLLKMTILLISISCFNYYFYVKIENMNSQNNNPSKSEAKTHLLDPEKMNLVICVNLNKTLKLEGNKYRYYYTYYYDFNRNKMTLKQIEQATDSVFNDTIDEIYLQFQNKKIKTNWSVTSKVFFKGKEEYTEIRGIIVMLTRCFQIEANPKEPKYQSLLATSKLIVKFKIGSCDLYLLPEEERFNSESFQYINNNFLKVIKKRANWIMQRRCADFDKKYSDCNSKQNCIDRCVNKRFIETYKSYTIYSIVDKDHFTKYQWSNSLPNNDFSIFNKTKQECLKEFKDDCNEVKFEDDKANQDSFVDKTAQLALFYNVISEIEEEASLYKLLMDVLTMQSVLFGQNIFELLLIIYCLLNTKYQLRNNKYYFYFIYLICLTGFVYHFCFLFNEVLNGDLIHFVYYAFENSLKVSEIIFCIDLDLKTDRNHKLTESYLNEATRYLRIETVFKNITYLNESNKWITLDSNFTNSELKVETFYFLDKKCFKIKQDIEYSRDQFYLLDNKEVLRLSFNNASYLTTIHLFTKIENKMQFSKIEKLFFYKYNRYTYSLNQEITELIYNDKFSWINQIIKNPFLLLQDNDNLNDANFYLLNLIRKFDVDYNLRTLIIPPEKEYLNNEINDDLFEEYFKQNIDFDSPTNSQIVRFFIRTNIKENKVKSLNGPDFEFELNFLKSVIKYTYKISFTKVILNFLNVLSLWFNLCILDLHVYIYYAYSKIVLIFKIFIFIHNQMTKIKNCLLRSISFNLFMRKINSKYNGLKFKKIKPFL